MKPNTILALIAGVVLLAGCGASKGIKLETVEPPKGNVPGWASDIIFYQIFPERFRNGDPKNDPTRETLEYNDNVPATWAVSPWTGDWYARAEWEKTLGDNFYENGVFHRRYGGDLQGVIDELDYVQRLGINTIYFNPVFYARSLHKYEGNTYHHIEPYFGPDPAGDLRLMDQETSDPSTWHWTAADKLFLELLKQAHQRGIRVVIDGVFNHTGRDFFAFADIRKNGSNSPYKDWYIIQQYDDPSTSASEFKYKGWWGVESMPEFADTPDGTDLHPGPKKYVMDASARWMDPNDDGDPSDGIDGWRLDVANEVPVKFWADWNAMLRKINPQTYTVTEIWENAADYIQRGGFSATMNYHGFAFPVKGFLLDGKLKPSEFARLLNERRALYPQPVQYAMQNLIDSHDTPRQASMIVNASETAYEQPDRYDFDVGRLVSSRASELFNVRKPNERERNIQRLAALFEMTYVGAPMVYYGTEAGMWGGDDPDDRMPMVWPDLKYADQVLHPRGQTRQADPVVFDQTLFDYYRAVISLRRDHAALRRGDFTVLSADDDRNTLVYRRSLGSENVVLILNRSEQAQPLSIGVDGSYNLVFATGSERPVVKKEAEGLSITVPALTGLVLVLSN